LQFYYEQIPTVNFLDYSEIPKKKEQKAPWPQEEFERSKSMLQKILSAINRYCNS